LCLGVLVPKQWNGEEQILPDRITCIQTANLARSTVGADCIRPQHFRSLVLLAQNRMPQRADAICPYDRTLLQF
jgi:hypothetical protein